MSHLIWSPSALVDVQRLYRFLAQKDKNAAQRAIKAIRTGITILAHQPQLGRPALEMEPPCIGSGSLILAAVVILRCISSMVKRSPFWLCGIKNKRDTN